MINTLIPHHTLQNVLITKENKLQMKFKKIILQNKKKNFQCGAVDQHTIVK